VIVEAGAVISMGVFIAKAPASTIGSAMRSSTAGYRPAPVVVPGTLPAANGKYGLACAVIVKRVDAQTRAKTSLNDLLRNTD